MFRRLRWLCLGLLIAGCVAGRAGTATPGPRTLTPPATGAPATLATNGAPPASPTAPAPDRNGGVWVPPQFAPEARAAGGPTLAGQLAQFERAHAGWAVRVRAKTAAGPGGLLESLLAADIAAPAALPDVVALTRADLEAAAAAGVLVPLDDWVPLEVLQDAYPFAQALGRVQGQWVGLPFAADARVLVYDAGRHAGPPVRWADVVTGTLIVPAAEAAGLTVLADYLAAGGRVVDPDGRPALDRAILSAALAELRAVQQAGVLPLSTLSYADPAATWQVFRERRATLAVTSASWYLAEAGRVEGSAAALPPTGNGAPFTLADGWCWALVDKGDDRAAAAELLNWLADPARLAEWTLAARVLPPRAAALARWGDSAGAPLAAEVLPRAQLPPAGPVLEVVGPLLRQALDDVLNGRAAPEAAADRAAQAVADLQP